MSDSGTEPKSRPRFVAGAVCPNCGAVDRMVIDANAERRRCVACEFVEARPDAPAEQPVTRVTRASAGASNACRGGVTTIVKIKRIDIAATYRLRSWGEFAKSIGIH